MEPVVINLNQKFQKISRHWDPKLIAELNGQAVKLAKIKGEYVWHHHQNEDEMFLVIFGNLIIKLPDKELLLQPGEMVVIPKGIEHCPQAEEECHILMFEPVSTINTGNIINEHTNQNPQKI